MPIRSAGIIIVGDEILSGRVKDENVYFMCQRFQDLGVRVDKIVTVGDNIHDIAEEVNYFSESFDFVIISGGVGPTHDDVTYQAVGNALGLELELNETLLFYWKKDPNENDISIRNMSTVPKSSEIIFADLADNKKAPVVNVKNVFLFPGTPQLLQARFMSLEQQYFSGYGNKFFKREIFLSVDETSILKQLNQVVDMFKDVAIGSYPEIDNPNYFTRITFHSNDEKRVLEACNMLQSLIEPTWIIDPSTFQSSSNPSVYKSKI